MKIDKKNATSAIIIITCNTSKDSEGNWQSSQCPVMAIKTLFVMTKKKEEEELKLIK